MKIKIQENTNDCGFSILNYFYKKEFRKNIDITTLKNEADISSEGISIFEMKKIANLINLNLNTYEIKFEKLINKNIKNFVAIILKDGYFHFIVVKKICRDYFLCLDPSVGKVKISFSEMKKIYLKTVIFFEKINSKNNILLKNNKVNLPSFKKTYFLFCIIFLLKIFVSFLSNFYIKTTIENIIPFKNISLLNQNLIFFTILTITNCFLFFLSFLIFNYLKINYEKFFYKKVLQKIKKDNFYLRKAGKTEIIKKINLIPLASEFKINYKFLLYLEIMSLFISALILWKISWLLFIFSTILMSVYLLVNIFFSLLIKGKYVLNLKNSQNFFISYYDLINSQTETIEENLKNLLVLKVNKNLGMFQQFNFIFLKSNFISSFFSNFINGFIPIIIFYLGNIYFFKKEISISSLFLFINLLFCFFIPTKKISDLLINYKSQKEIFNLVTNMLKINPKKNAYNFYFLKNKDHKKIIYFKDFSFKINPVEKMKIPELIINKNLRIQGRNSSGKSTFLRIIKSKNNNFLQNFYNYEKFNPKILYLGSKDPIFNILISDSIHYQNPKLKINFEQNSEKFKLRKFLLKNNINIQKKIIDNGDSLSFGQKQIINLMKIFSQKYDFIILDEALENIDENNIKFLKKSILSYQKDAIFLEVSHNKKFITENNYEELNIEKYKI